MSADKSKPPRVEGEAIASPPDAMTVALSLAKHGWPVFPVKLVPWTQGERAGTDKRPLVKWLEGATTDLETIATWWGVDFPGSWIGVHAGRAGIVTVDLDTDKGQAFPKGHDLAGQLKGDGRANLAAAGIDLPDTLRYKTRSGGTHHVFAAPSDKALTIASDTPVPSVDIRAGNGLMVYYGPTLTDAPQLAPAPAWAILELAKGAATYDRNEGDVGAWLARTVPGKTTRDVKAAEALASNDMEHAAMLKAVSELVKLGKHRGAGAAYERARSAYLAGRPDRARDWDNAAAGSVAQHGLPPVTFTITKAERKALKGRRARPAGPRPASRENAGALPAQDDDAGLAVIVGEHFRDSVAFVPGFGWRVYTGTRWRDSNEPHVLELVRAHCKRLGHHAFDNRDDRTAKWLRRGSTIVRAAQFLKGQVERSAEEFDADHDTLNTPSGVVHLPTGELRAHGPELLLTRITRASYAAGAKHPDVSAALKALPREVREHMQVRAGQAATGHTPDDDVVPIIQGEGENGKSTILSGLLAALGGYSALMPDKLLLARDGDHPTALMDLFGVRLAISEELPEGHRLNVKRLKDIVGTPRMKARLMRQDFVEWSPTHTLWVSSNYLPRIAETDHGTWRRLALVKFPYRYVADPKAEHERLADRRLRGRITGGRAGRDEALLAWVVEGAKQWYAAGMITPPLPERVRADTDDWREGSDAVLAFANDRLVFGPEAHVSSHELIYAVNQWLRSNGQQEMGRETIASRFGEHDTFRSNNVRKVRRRMDDGTRPNLWLGVGLRPNQDVLNSLVTINR